MARIGIGSLAKASATPAPPGFAGDSTCRAYFSTPRDPLHLHLHTLAPGARLSVGPLAADCVVYVWDGDAAAGDTALERGSSLIVERGAVARVTGGANGAIVLAFAASGAPRHARAGGHVHLLPAERVPRYKPAENENGVRGGLHADAACPTCEVWLHENHMPGMSAEAARETADKGVHCHSEDEIIFVTGGQMRLGAKLFAPGTALAIPAGTMYSFTPGPEGVSFINFRAAASPVIVMKHGGEGDEAAYWRERVAPPEYIAGAQAGL